MRYRWIGKNVDVDVLGLSLERFLVEKGFSTNREFENDEQIIMATVSEKDKIRSVTVKICGSRDDFQVDFSAGGEGGSIVRLAPLATIFGFGFLVKSELEKRDYFNKIEADFWVYADKCIAELAVSTAHS